ncbi:MAG: hypothetical protein KBF57_07865, partial [Saprospiraceae bacterium]|nr:hypothetical protein [Saprospiraceae bacterium]
MKIGKSRIRNRYPSHHKSVAGAGIENRQIKYFGGSKVTTQNIASLRVFQNEVCVVLRPIHPSKIGI